ncbi:MAG: hypothetical protein ABIR29_11740 [Chthoniobacterales bacterium]
MAYLSIRNLPAHLEKKVIAEARRRHTTKTAIVIECIEKAIAAKDEKPTARTRRVGAKSTFSQRWSGSLVLTKRDDPRVSWLKSKYGL